MQTIKHLIAIVFICFFFQRCSKDSVIPEPPTIPSAQCAEGVPLLLRSAFRFNQEALNANKAYPINDTAWVVLREADIYLSELNFLESNNEMKVQNSVQLLRFGKDSIFNLGVIPKGNYTGVRFSTGLNQTLNHADPSTYPAGHPLNFQVPSLHWSWNQGYIFARFEGSYGRDSLEAISASDNFSYHIGLDENYMDNIERSFDLDATICKEFSIRMVVNSEILFEGLNIFEENFSMSTSFPLVSRKVNINLKNAFYIIP